MSLKWILGIISFLIIASIVVVYIILSSYDFNKLKPVITQKVQDVTGRELRLGGDIKLDIGFTPALVMEDVSFQNAQWGSRPEMAKIKRFEVKVALIPLIGKNIKIKRLIFIEPDVLIESDGAGRSNLDLTIVTEQEQDKSERRDEEEGLQLVGLTFNHVRIDKGRLVYKNGKSGKNYTLMLDSLNAYASNDDSPVEIEIVGHYNNEPFAVNGNIGALAGFFDPERSWPLKLTARAADATAVIEGEFKDILNLKGLSISIKSEGRSISKITELSGITDIPDLGQFKATFRISDTSGRLAIEALDIGLGTEELIEARLIGSISDPLSRKGIDLEFSGQGRELKDLGEFFDKKIPLQGPFSVSCRVVDSGDERFDISDLKATLVGSDMTGSIEVDLSGKRPILKSNLSSNKLDLRVFSAEDSGIPEKAKEPEEAAEKKERLFPQEPIPMDIL